MFFLRWITSDSIKIVAIVGIVGGVLSGPIASAVLLMLSFADWSEWPTWQILVVCNVTCGAIGGGLGAAIGLTAKKYLHLQKVRSGMEARAKEMSMSALPRRTEESIKNAMYYPKVLRSKNPSDQS